MKVYVVDDNVYIDKIFSTFETAERYVIDAYNVIPMYDYDGYITYGKEGSNIGLYSIDEYEVEE